MSTKRMRRWLQAMTAGVGAGVLFQQGCAVDPDVVLQSFTQFFTEFAIFVVDNAIVATR